MPARQFNFRTRHTILAFLTTVCVMFLAGCGDDAAPLQTSTQTALPKDACPCAYPEYWPYNVASSRHPFIVHYRSPDELTTARRIIAFLDTAWQRQIIEQGYEPPPSDSGMCGPDGRFDVFIRRGVNSCKVDLITEEFVTRWGGRASYMQVDPWGDYGGDKLAATIAHEFNHSTHAANDWYDLPISFEMSASYVDQFYGPQDVRDILDFQKHPDWGLLRNDSYLTYYMYGSALYLHFLRDRYFGVDDSFLPLLWVNMRNTPDLLVNKPNFVDALNSLLVTTGTVFGESPFLDTVPEFARWRYYAGDRRDSRHFRNLNDDRRPTSLPPVPEEWQMALITQATLPITSVTMPLPHDTYEFDPAPMMTGTVYLTVHRQNTSQASFQLSLVTPPDPAVKWVVQAVPGIVEGSDGETVDLSSGAARIFFASGGARTLIVTALPAAASGFDPDFQTAFRYPVSVRITP
ncbi:MAG: hypothetical protein EG828_08655 [Deltaproteobacteria bacterium]|nr:hypothetical protein [Deltaproteobacteria bacterium]